MLRQRYTYTHTMSPLPLASSQIYKDVLTGMAQIYNVCSCHLRSLAACLPACLPACVRACLLAFLPACSFLPACLPASCCHSRPNIPNPCRNLFVPWKRCTSSTCGTASRWTRASSRPSPWCVGACGCEGVY